MVTSYQIPTQKTLDKYGLSVDEWVKILKRQGFKCPICSKSPSTGRYYIDHFHITKWSSMPSEIRKTFVRGLLCYFCNRWYVGKGITIEKSKNVTKYLQDYEKRKTN